MVLFLPFVVSLQPLSVAYDYAPMAHIVSILFLDFARFHNGILDCHFLRAVSVMSLFTYATECESSHFNCAS
uniref:AlNc14C26G2537 protein n=1 Tax=Albugo laibachii Nc14 TaxID=890382 RepID=F0W6Q1_9STRA|nr:AlNc14C26G2537 [Albugo laibachii Nc14]|eukprot:CCA16796.1 AlNc14C26G2537 [Albugo laibachii Nc14]